MYLNRLFHVRGAHLHPVSSSLGVSQAQDRSNIPRIRFSLRQVEPCPTIYSREQLLPQHGLGLVHGQLEQIDTRARRGEAVLIAPGVSNAKPGVQVAEAQ